MVNVSIDARRNRNDESPITQEQRDKIQKASNKAYVIVRKGYNVLDKILDQSGTLSERERKIREAWMNVTEVKRWFGTDYLSPYQINQINNRLGRLKNNLEGTVRFRIIQHQTGDRSWLCNADSVAYCSGGSSIKLCPSFFYDKITNERGRAITVVHELCHHVGLIDRRVEGNKVYGRDPAKELAINDPREARKNPSNLAYFCDEYYKVQVFMGNTNTKEVHDLDNEKTGRNQCQIDEIIAAGHAKTFNPDTLEQAHKEGYDNCAHCIGQSEK